MNVVHRLLLLLVIIHGRIAGRRRLVDDAIVRVVGWISHDRLLVDGWVLVAGHHVIRRVGRADRVDVVADWVKDNRLDNDDLLCVYRQEQVDN